MDKVVLQNLADEYKDNKISIDTFYDKITSQVKAEKDKDYYIEDDSVFYNKNKIFSFGRTAARELVITKLSKKLKLNQLKGGLEYLLSK